MVVKNIEQVLQQDEMAKQCPFSSNHINFANLSDESAQIKNFITNKTLQDTLHQQSRKQVCPVEFCNGKCAF